MVCFGVNMSRCLGEYRIKRGQWHFVIKKPDMIMIGGRVGLLYPTPSLYTTPDIRRSMILYPSAVHIPLANNQLLLGEQICIHRMPSFRCGS